MLFKTTLFTLFASSVIARGALQAEGARGLIDLSDIRGRQTDGGSECATVFQPLLTAMPSLPSDLISFWKDNNPQTKGCLAQPPPSLTSQFASVSKEYGSWISSNAATFSSIASKCPQYNFGGGSFGGAKRAEQSQPYPTLPPEAATWLKFATATGLPSEWAAFGTYTPCPGTIPSPSVTTPGNLHGVPTESASVSTPSAVLVNAGAHETALPVGVMAIAGVFVVIAAM